MARRLRMSQILARTRRLKAPSGSTVQMTRRLRMSQLLARTRRLKPLSPEKLAIKAADDRERRDKAKRMDKEARIPPEAEQFGLAPYVRRPLPPMYPED